MYKKFNIFYTESKLTIVFFWQLDNFFGNFNF